MHQLMAATVVALLSIASADPAFDALVGHGEMALANVTRHVSGDYFIITGTDCGPTRCMEASGGTALPAPGGAGICLCQCRADLPVFREDRRVCVAEIDECQMASFGRGVTVPSIPFVFLPMKGQIIHPSKEIVFTDEEKAVCAVTGAQYLSNSGWVTLRDIMDHDVPFGLFRDEGKTFLQWRGSQELRARMEGRVVLAHVLCRTGERANAGYAPPDITTPCAAFRVAGSPSKLLLDVRSVIFSAGEPVTPEPASLGQGLSVLESLAIGVCVLIVTFIYAAGIMFYLHVKRRRKKREKDAEMNKAGNMGEGGGSLEARLEMEANMQIIKTNPLLKIESFTSNMSSDEYTLDSAGGLSDVSECIDETSDSDRMMKKPTLISAVVHSTRKKSTRIAGKFRPSVTKHEKSVYRKHCYLPDAYERIPESNVAIVDHADFENQMKIEQPYAGQARRKLYFNPVFFETEHLKNPPDAAIEFLIKIREVMSIAKEKMIAKRFVPVLPRIPEEEFYNVLDFGWDYPCYPIGRRLSVVSLKRENSRRTHNCSGCPGCETKSLQDHPITTIGRSNSCKSCLSEEVKQKIVRKWLEDVPLVNSPNVDTLKMPQKSIAKVSGTPRSIEPKKKEDIKIEIPRIEKKDIVVVMPGIATLRRTRKKMPPPPPPPTSADRDRLELDLATKKTDEEINIPIPKEVKQKMEAVIKEMTECRRVDPLVPNVEETPTEYVTPFIPNVVLSIKPTEVSVSDEFVYKKCVYDKPKLNQAVARISSDNDYDADSLERSARQNQFIIERPKLFADNSRLDNRRMSFKAMDELEPMRKIHEMNTRLCKSFRDTKPKHGEIFYENTRKPPIASCVPFMRHEKNIEQNTENLVSEVYINNFVSPSSNTTTIDKKGDNFSQPGPLTIEVKGSPVSSRKSDKEEFDPDTLDRKPVKAKLYYYEEKKKVDKIMLKSAGSFKCKNINPAPEPENNSVSIDTENSIFTRKLGSLRQIYESKNMNQMNNDSSNYRIFEMKSNDDAHDTENFSTFASMMKAPDLIQPGLQITSNEVHVDNVNSKDPKPPLPPKQSPVKRTFAMNASQSKAKGEKIKVKHLEEQSTNKSDSEKLNSTYQLKKNGRKSARYRNKRAELKKVNKTEDSGYLSTDSNESKQRSRFVLQIRDKSTYNDPTAAKEDDSASDTDDVESLGDGQSESGGESIETNSVFFGNFRKRNVDSQRMLNEFIEVDDNCNEIEKIKFEDYIKKAMANGSNNQMDSGFQGETIIQSGESDSEHKSIISIVTSGRTSDRSVKTLNDGYRPSVEC